MFFKKKKVLGKGNSMFEEPVKGRSLGTIAISQNDEGLGRKGQEMRLKKARTRLEACKQSMQRRWTLSEGIGKPLRGYKQGSDMVRFAF